MKCALIGYGEIGKGVYDVYSPYNDITIIDPMKGYTIDVLENVDLLLIAMPYSKTFISDVKTYSTFLNPKATIIFSTVPIGTTRQIPNAVHSPVEGRHPHLAESIKKFTRYVGAVNGCVPNVVTEFITNVAHKWEYCICSSPDNTEFLKLQSTSNYGVMIEYARYVKSVCDSLGMDYEDIKTFNESYNELYKELNMPQFQRYILDAPEGNIGGHCVVPNAILLDKQFPSMFLKEIYRDKENTNG